MSFEIQQENYYLRGPLFPENDIYDEKKSNILKKRKISTAFPDCNYNHSKSKKRKIIQIKSPQKLISHELENFIPKNIPQKLNFTPPISPTNPCSPKQYP